MSDALFGFTGLVGQTLLRQRRFDVRYRSTNVGESRGREFDTVICAAAPAKKWWANQHASEDRATIEQLAAHLTGIHCRRFVLISTVDVFVQPVEVDEHSVVVPSGLCPYGLHRYWLEQQIRKHFERATIVRLPGLVGPGLKKNVIFDFHNGNNIDAIDSRGLFQFYPLVNLWCDIQTAVRSEFSTVHLTAEPISVREVAAEGFGIDFANHTHASPARYDLQSAYGTAFGTTMRYQYSRRETLLALRAYAQSEPRVVGS